MAKITENTVDEILNQQVDGGFVLDHRLGNVVVLGGVHFSTNYSYSDLTEAQVGEYVAKVEAYNNPKTNTAPAKKDAKKA